MVNHDYKLKEMLRAIEQECFFTRGLTGRDGGRRRTRVHPWERPATPRDEPESHREDGSRPEYDEDYDRIH